MLQSIVLSSPSHCRIKILIPNVDYFQKFESRVNDDGEMANIFREKLLEYLDSLQLRLVKILESYHDNLKYYSDTLEKSIENVTSYFNQNDFIKVHVHTKNAAQSQFVDEVREFDDKLIFAYRRRLDTEIEDNVSTFEQMNDVKRRDFIVSDQPKSNWVKSL